MSTLQLKHITKRFGDTVVLDDIDLSAEEGEFVALVGPSGCGKSTLLRIISGLEPTTSGEIVLDGRRVNDVSAAQRGLAMVFQSYALYPHMSVARNIGFPLKMARQPAEMIEAKVKKAAATLNLTEYLDRRPGQLSGGQRQRVAIGRAIVREPKAFLFDEPLSNLDAALRVQMRLEIGDLHQALKTTMIYVTHDQVEAMTMADTIVVLDRGAIAQVGTPLELYNRPDNLFVARFIGSPTMNVVAGASAQKRNAATLGVRPEHIDLSTSAGEWKGRVRQAEHLGSDTFVYADVEGIGAMTVRQEGEAPLKPGDAVYMTPQEPRLHRFDAQGRRIN
jgi:multiple sugar transport system ATP-binding protein